MFWENLGKNHCVCPFRYFWFSPAAALATCMDWLCVAIIWSIAMLPPPHACTRNFNVDIFCVYFHFPLLFFFPGDPPAACSLRARIQWSTWRMVRFSNKQILGWNAWQIRLRCRASYAATFACPIGKSQHVIVSNIFFAVTSWTRPPSATVCPTPAFSWYVV